MANPNEVEVDGEVCREGGAREADYLRGLRHLVRQTRGKLATLRERHPDKTVEILAAVQKVIDEQGGSGGTVH
jgi:hypothetical protein